MNNEFERVTIKREGEMLETGGDISIELKHLSSHILSESELSVLYIIGNPYPFMVKMNADMILEHHTKMPFKELSESITKASVTLQADNGATIDFVPCGEIELLQGQVLDHSLLVVSSSCFSNNNYQNKMIEQLLNLQMQPDRKIHFNQ
ncbi:hypothetical protein [Vibrio owensii]|uniref:hypothetical protein n=1 Tax=Vibrio harveyi group TaxID=717610 RepID=UPI003CC5DAAD